MWLGKGEGVEDTLTLVAIGPQFKPEARADINVSSSWADHVEVARFDDDCGSEMVRECPKGCLGSGIEEEGRFSDARRSVGMWRGEVR